MTCGWGQRAREVDDLTRPLTHDLTCPQCSVTCGWGQRTREVTCHPAEGLCSDADRPRDTQQCRRRMCRSGSAEDTDTGTDSDDSESESESESLTDSWMVSEWSEQVRLRSTRMVGRVVGTTGSCPYRMTE